MHGKDTEKKSEDGGLVKGGVDQGLLFKAATEAEHISDHDDFCKDQRFDHGHPVIRVRYIVGSQKESSVHCEGSEYEREINDIYPVLDQLMEYFFLQIPFFLSGLFIIHILHGKIATATQLGSGTFKSVSIKSLQHFNSAREYIAREIVPPEIFRGLNPFCKRMRVA